MPHGPQDPTGGAVRNLFFLQRAANTLHTEAAGLLEDLFDDIAAEIARLDPTAPPQETYRRQRIEKIVGTIEDLAGSSFEEITRVLRDRLARLGSQQASWAATHLRDTIGSVGVDIRTGGLGVNRMKAILDADPFRGETLRGWTDTQRAAVVRRARREIQIGMTNNETIDQLVRRIRGRQAGWIRQDPATGRFVPAGTRGANVRPRFTGAVLGTTTRETEAIVRTAVNHISNQGHLETYRQNDDIVNELEFTATLDTRTTIVCASLDGTVWAIDSPDIQVPPLHYNCRSVLTPRVNWAGLGIEPPEAGSRASMDGQVSAATRYEGWLRDQPAAVQDEVLGPFRARLFRDGRVALRDLVTRDNRILRLDELDVAA